MRPWAVRTIGLAFIVVSLSCIAQVKDIDSTKLPQSPAVQAAYRNAQDLERYADTWSVNWNYNIPKAQVEDKLADDLGILTKALKDNPSNHELQLLTGLVAHFAYNLNDEAAFEIAKDNLSKAAADPADLRGEWFLGIHQCQALQVVDGMNRLLDVEAKDKNPPADFWYDYVTCASIAILPAHTLRAIDRAVAGGESPESYHQLSEIAASRYKAADLTQTIPSHTAWTGEQLPNNRLALTSHLCGISFAVGDDRDLQVGDVSNGVCTVTSNPPIKKGTPVATILLMAKRPVEGQSLDDFVKSFLKDHDTFNDGKTQVSTASDLPCPVERCLALDLLVPGIYWKQGGGHILVVAFERDQPRYDGLPFEKPQGPPVVKPKEKPVAFRFNYILHRIPGKLYYLVLLDSNQQIFAGSKPEFQEFLKSFVVE